MAYKELALLLPYIPVDKEGTSMERLEMDMELMELALVVAPLSVPYQSV